MKFNAPEHPIPNGARRVAVIGSGYVGLTLSACLASIGHDVTCTDKSIERVGQLAAGQVPIVEEGLTEIVQQALADGKLRFSLDNVHACRRAEFVFLCLPTPEGADGQADLSFVQAVAVEIGSCLGGGTTVITKSTVPVGTSELVRAALGRRDVHVVSNPEFLAEGRAVRDSLDPDRIVVGAESKAVALEVAALYGTLGLERSIITDVRSAELIKYASNAYLATRLTFVNSMAELCEAAGADVRAVMQGMGADARIGPAFLSPGPGWGGSCFPKDTTALVRTAASLGCDLLLVRAAIEANGAHTARIVAKVRGALGGRLDGARIAVWGLSFKAGTDDLRQSPALAIVRLLQAAGAEVHAYDPTVRPGALDGIETHASSFAACRGADAVVIATEWPEFANVDLTALVPILGQRIVVDARNLLDPDVVAGHGFCYVGVGVPDRAVASEEFAA